MDLTDIVHQRYSVRKYQTRPVEAEKINQILEAARLAPTACNQQPFRISVIPTAGHEKELGRIYSRPWFAEAPLVICMCADAGHGWVRKDGKNYSEIDATIAMDHLVLTATGLGLGTCWIAAFDALAAREILHLPANLEPLVFTPLGYPADTPFAKTRKSLEELVIRHQW
jgi:nitroreductase